MRRLKNDSGLRENEQYRTMEAALLEKGYRCLSAVDGPNDSVMSFWAYGPRKGTLIVQADPECGIDLYPNETPHSWDEIMTWLDG